jgi:hypothetical protein
MSWVGRPYDGVAEVRTGREFLEWLDTIPTASHPQRGREDAEKAELERLIRRYPDDARRLLGETETEPEQDV